VLPALGIRGEDEHGGEGGVEGRDATGGNFFFCWVSGESPGGTRGGGGGGQGGTTNGTTEELEPTEI